MNFIQISHDQGVREKLFFNHTIANVFKHASYFERKGNVKFETFPDGAGLGDAIVAIIRFPSGHHALIGTRPSTMNRGVELLCSKADEEAVVLAEFKQAFPEIADEEIDTRKV